MILDRSNKKVKSRISSTETKRNLAKFEIFRNPRVCQKFQLPKKINCFLNLSRRHGIKNPSIQLYM